MRNVRPHHLRPAKNCRPAKVARAAATPPPSPLRPFVTFNRSGGIFASDQWDVFGVCSRTPAPGALVPYREGQQRATLPVWQAVRERPVFAHLRLSATSRIDPKQASKGRDRVRRRNEASGRLIDRVGSVPSRRPPARRSTPAQGGPLPLPAEGKMPCPNLPYAPSENDVAHAGSLRQKPPDSVDYDFCHIGQVRDTSSSRGRNHGAFYARA